MTTRWSAVLLSAQSQAPGSDRAREEFCQLYWYPLYAFIRRRGYNPDDARDLTQGFFLFILGRKALQRATPEKGKFRSFLLGSLRQCVRSSSGNRLSLITGPLSKRPRESALADSTGVVN
jgi:hypothetical protein